MQKLPEGEPLPFGERCKEASFTSILKLVQIRDKKRGNRFRRLVTECDPNLHIMARA
jgi:hypothetical protein